LSVKTAKKPSKKKPTPEPPLKLSPPSREDIIADAQRVAKTLPEGEELSRGYYRAHRNKEFKEKDIEGHFPKFPYLIQAAGLKIHQPKEENPSQNITDEEQDLIYDKNYIYNKESDTYITPLPRSLGGKSIILPGEIHRAMLKAYSNMAGGSETINEICRRFEFRRDWFVEYKALHGWTHDKEPFTSEELVSRDVNEMADDLVQQRRLKVYNSFRKKEWQATITDAKNWNHLEQSVITPLTELIKQTLPDYRPPLVALPTSDEPYALVVAPFDLHFGKYGWMDETGQGYSRTEARDLLIDKTNELAKYVAKLGRPELIIVASGSDWFHIDNQWGTTTRGTPQDLDGTPSQILMEGCELAYDHIEMLRQLTPAIKYLNVPGNHDFNNSISMAMFLLGKYAASKDVEIINSPQKKRQYAAYGNSLLGFAHGDCVAPKDMMSAMVKEAKDLFTKSEFQYFFSGHLHHEVAREIGGLTTFQLKSLSGLDRFHTKHGYITSGRALQSFVVSRTGGITMQINCNVKGDTLFGIKERNVNTKAKAMHF